MRIVREVFVDLKSHALRIAVFGQIQPRRTARPLPDVPPAQDHDVGGHLRVRVLLERRVRQPDGSQEISALGQVAAQGRVELVQGALGGDERYQAAGADFFDAFGEEVVVDEEAAVG